MPAFSPLQLASATFVSFDAPRCWRLASCGPISLKRAFCSSFSERLNASSAGRTVLIASLVACNRWIIACKRPGGVIGTASGQASVNRTAASADALRRSSSSAFWSSFGCTASAICSSGHAVMPLAWSAQKSRVVCVMRPGVLGRLGAEPVVTRALDPAYGPSAAYSA